MVVPTASQIREWSKLGFGELGFADDVSMGRLVARAAAAFTQITGLKLVDVPAEQEPLVEHAIQGLTESLAFQAQPDNLETLADFDLLQSFSAGPYSEQRRSPEDALKARMLHPWPWLNSLLWGLLTPEQREFWDDHFGGPPAPAFGVTEMDWNDYSYDDEYRASRDVMWGPGA